jgi:hypothetical protein
MLQQVEILLHPESRKAKSATTGVAAIENVTLDYKRLSYKMARSLRAMQANYQSAHDRRRQNDPFNAPTKILY